MKNYEVVTKRMLIRKDLVKIKKINDNDFRQYDSNILFSSYAESLEFFSETTKDLKIKLFKDSFGINYYAIFSIFLNELVVDDTYINKAFIKNWDELNNNYSKAAIYANVISENFIDKKIYTIEDLKNIIKWR